MYFVVKKDHVNKSELCHYLTTSISIRHTGRYSSREISKTKNVSCSYQMVVVMEELQRLGRKLQTQDIIFLLPIIYTHNEHLIYSEFY